MQISTDAPRAAAGVTAEQQRLQYRSMDLELAIRDNRGREAYVSFSMESLDYSRTYTRFGQISGAAAGAGSPAERARLGTVTELVHQHEELSYQRQELAVSGDAELLADYFGAEATAQRIVDFARNLAPDLDPGEAGFGDFLDQISRGIRDGFEQAQEILGGALPEISEQTRSLVEEMLAALRAEHDAPAATEDDASMAASSADA